MSRILGGLVLGSALMAVVGWPVLATAIEAARDVASGTAGDLEVARPLSLALETARVVAATEAIALPIGLALAWLLFRTDLWGRRGLLGLFGLALFVPLPLHAIAWLGSFGNQGRAQAILGLRPILVGWPGAAFVHAMAALPWVVFIAGVGLRGVEPELEEAAWLDLPAWRVVLHVTFRRAIGAIAGSALAVAVLTAGDMTVTDLLQVRTYAEQAYLLAQRGIGQGAVAAEVALPAFAVLGVLVLVGAVALLRADPARLPTPANRARVWHLGRWRVGLGVLVVGLVGGAVALPIAGMVWRAGRVGGVARLGIAPHWSLAGLLGTLPRAWEDVIDPSTFPEEFDRSPLIGSMIWAALGATLTVALAWPLAWACRGSRPWRWVTATVAALILASPGPVAALALKLAYRMVPIVADTPALLVLAYGLRTLPYALLVLWPALRSIPQDHLDAAAVDGLGPWRRAWRVALPMSRGAIAAAWAVSFALAVGELPAAFFTYTPGRLPLIVVVWGLLHTGVESHLAGVGLILTAVAGTIGLAAAWTLGRIYEP